MNLIPKLENHNGMYVVSSRIIANHLEKRHCHILDSIDKLLLDNSRFFKNQSTDISVNLEKMISSAQYKDSKNRNFREYLLTKDGFILFMSNIQGYNDFKLAYINEFNRMEQVLNNQTLPFKKEKYIEVVDKIPREELLSMRKMIKMLTQEIEKDVKQIQNILGKIEDHKAHINVYTSILNQF